MRSWFGFCCLYECKCGLYGAYCLRLDNLGLVVYFSKIDLESILDFSFTNSHFISESSLLDSHLISKSIPTPSLRAKALQSTDIIYNR